MKATLLTGGHLTSEALDLLLLGSLDAADQATVTRHCQACARCQTQLDELKADQAHFSQFVLPRTVQAVEQRATPKGFFAQFRLAWLLAAVGAAAAIAVAVVAFRPGATEEAYVGIKGDGVPTLRVFGRRGTSDVFSVKSGAQLQANDRLRFEVVPNGYSHLLIASIDGQGTFNVYYPFAGSQAALLPPTTSVELDGSIELDDVTGHERLVAVFAKRAVKADEVRQAMEARPAQPHLEGTQVVVLEFEKE